MFKCEVELPLGCFDVYIRAELLEKGASVVVYQDINGGEYYDVLMSLGSYGDVLGKAHHFCWSASGRLMFAATAGTLAHVVNATADEREKFARTLSEICGRLESEETIRGVK